MPHLQVFKSKERLGEWGAKRAMREIHRDEETETGKIKIAMELKQEKEERSLKMCPVWDCSGKKRDYFLQ